MIDGAKVLRAAINAAFGPQQPVQRCRAYKLRNVLDQEQVKSVLRASWRLGGKEGMNRIRKLAAWLEREWAASLLEWLDECFTINLGVPPSLHCCLATTNIIESPGVRIRTRRSQRNVNRAQATGMAVGTQASLGLVRSRPGVRPGTHATYSN